MSATTETQSSTSAKPSTDTKVAIQVTEQKELQNENQNNEEPNSIKMAEELYNQSKSLLKEMNIEEAITFAARALEIAELSVEDTNDVILANYFMQYGKCLLESIQQCKNVFGDTCTSNDNQDDIDQDEVIKDASNTTNDNNTEITEQKSKSDEIDETEQESKQNNNNNNNNEEEQHDINEDDEEQQADEFSEQEPESDREAAWNSLEYARVILEKHLETLGINVNEQKILHDLQDIIEEESEKGTNESSEVLESNEKKESKVDQNENETSEETDSDQKHYLLLLAEVHTLLGDHQLEDNKFDGALESYQTALSFREQCSETNRELAFSHYMASLAAYHGKNFDVMEEHCNSAIDLINDNILQLIDNFKDSKYTERTQEELTLDSLNELVTDFVSEYEGKKKELTESQQKDLTEISSLLDMMHEVMSKMDNELEDAKEIEGLQIKDMVMNLMQQAKNGGLESGNNINQENNNNQENGISGIGFGSGFSGFSGFTSSNGNEEINTINTLNVKSTKSKSKSKEKVTKESNQEVINTISVVSTQKKRSMDEAGITDEPSPTKKHKVNGKHDLDDIPTPSSSTTTDKVKTTN